MSTYTVINPSTAEPVTEVALATVEQTDALIERAQEASLGYREFLDLILEEEYGVVEGRRYALRLKLSGLPNHKTLEEFDCSF